jgi:sarcosine oxidase subunit alpha
MTQTFRLGKGGLVDRGKPLSFMFDGRRYEGYAGDTLASALLANGVHFVARSFKYHRPRGILGAGAEDPAALVQAGPDMLRTDPNTRATELELYDGLEAHPQNAWPSLDRDIGALNDLAWRWLPAGFYYKTFFNWMSVEPSIRKAAGLGKPPEGPDPERYMSTNRHVEVLVVGGGPAGIMAALSAARSGARVILCEETAQLGGRLLALDATQNRIEGRSPADWVKAAEAELRAMPDVAVLTRTTAFGYYAENFVGLVESVQDSRPHAEREHARPRQRVWRVRASEVVLATGTIERPLVFHGNDRPGIMLASAVETYIHRYGVKPGTTALVATNNSSAYGAAFAMQDAGIAICTIVDARPSPEGGLIDEAKKRGIVVHAGSTIVSTAGRKRVRSAVVRRIDGSTGVTGPSHTFACDLIAVSGGFSPNAALFSQSRGKLRYDESIAAFRPGVSWQRERSAGGANGTLDLAAAFEEGARAGAEAATKAGSASTAAPLPALGIASRSPYSVAATWELPSDRPAHKARAFVDLQNDVQAKDLHLAVDEGYRSVEHVKRYTTTGMGTDQGKTVNVNAFGIVAGALGQSIPDTGVTTWRQPYKPVAFGALAGQHSGALYAPRRTTPMHDWHVERGAIFEPVGEWLRAQTYPKAGESFGDAVQRESKAARSGIAIMDASTLGKIDIRGKDTRELLNRIYTNSWTRLAPGKARYGLMLKEDGMVFDDGVTACLADDHFHMTTTTGGAARVLNHLEEYLQTEWPELEVYCTSTTEQWAVASICGPRCEQIVAKVCDGASVAPEGFEFMTFRDGTAGGIPVRIYRISFTGALSYEINIPASYGLWLWERVFEAGRELGLEITPYGTEAMHLLRAEKGFIIVGQDTDGTITPGDLRMDWNVKKTGDFVGKRSLSRSDTARKDRRQLVGLVTDDPKVVLMEGAHLIDSATEPATKPAPMLGHVTSSYFSPNLKRSIALALVKGGGARMGEQLWVSRKEGAPIPVKVTEVDFLKTYGGAA